MKRPSPHNVAKLREMIGVEISRLHFTIRGFADRSGFQFGDDLDDAVHSLQRINDQLTQPIKRS